MKSALIHVIFFLAIVLMGWTSLAETCPTGYRCLPSNQCAGTPDSTGGTLTVVCRKDQLCLNGKCYLRDCPCSGLCNPDFTCMDPCTAKGTPCGLGTTCDTTGKCIPDPICAGMSCSQGRICDKGACVMQRPDTCLGVQCATGMTCIDGRCLDYCQGVVCAPGKKCQGGCCLDDPACSTRKCAVGTWCFNGVCSVPKVCQNVVCPKGQMCDYQGSCVGDPRCAHITPCRKGLVCDKGECVKP